MEKIIAIVPAAGLGSRLGLGKNKAFADVGGFHQFSIYLIAASGTVYEDAG